MTIPIAFIMGLYLQKLRPGQVGEMTHHWLGVIGLHHYLWSNRGSIGMGGMVFVGSHHIDVVPRHLWISGVRSPCLDPFGPSRLFVHIHEIGRDCLTRSRSHPISPHHRNAPNDRVYKRKRPNHSRHTLSISLYHDRMWGHIRVSFPCILRHDPKTHQPGIPSYCGIWCDAFRKFRRRDRSHCRVPIGSR